MSTSQAVILDRILERGPAAHRGARRLSGAHPCGNRGPGRRQRPRPSTHGGVAGDRRGGAVAPAAGSIGAFVGARDVAVSTRCKQVVRPGASTSERRASTVPCQSAECACRSRVSFAQRVTNRALPPTQASMADVQRPVGQYFLLCRYCVASGSPVNSRRLPTFSARTTRTCSGVAKKNSRRSFTTLTLDDAKAR